MSKTQTPIDDFVIFYVEEIAKINSTTESELRQAFKTTLRVSIFRLIQKKG